MTSVTCTAVPFALALELGEVLKESSIPSTGTSKARQASARPFLHSLNILVKYVRLYGFNHRRTQAQFDVAWTELREAVPKRKGAVVLGVSEDRLLLDGVPVEVGQAERGFAQLLNAAGIASIQFSSEVTIEEFESLVRAFSLGFFINDKSTTEMKRLFPDDKGNIRINEVKFVIADPATTD